MARRPNEAQLDELGNDPTQPGSAGAGQAGDTQGLSDIADASDLSVDELTEEDQALEAAIVDGVEDAANHPERPVHTHNEYRRPEDIAPENGSE